jgi:hypothetical protein
LGFFALREALVFFAVPVAFFFAAVFLLAVFLLAVFFAGVTT